MHASDPCPSRRSPAIDRGVSTDKVATRLSASRLESRQILQFAILSLCFHTLIYIRSQICKDSMASTRRPIPITVFTGFLGAGKTSIILSLLPRLPEDYKVVLLKNEFGDIEGERIPT